jgi:peptidoglycan/xylan/chitin deacetylase (PgdA/CDA1 family)
MRRFVNPVLAYCCRFLGLTRLLLSVTEMLTREKMLVAFTYHRVTDRSTGDLGYLIYDVGIDYRAFEIQLEVISKYFEIVGLQDYEKFVLGEKPLGKRSALLTFDDADSEFATYALPVMTSRNCPSVVFAPTDFIGTAKRFWHLRVTNVLSSVTERSWEAVRGQAAQFAQPIAAVIINSSVKNDDARGVACRALAWALDGLDPQEAEHCVLELEKITGVSYTLGVACMNWAELKKALGQGVAVESHTVTHRKLARLDPEAIRLELTQSRQVLEQKLGQRVTAICYPAGSFNDLVAEEAERAGYLVGFTTKHGLGGQALPVNELFRLRRVGMYGDTRYQAELHLAKLALKRLLRGRYFDQGDTSHSTDRI